MNEFYIYYMLKERRRRELEEIQRARLFRNNTNLQSRSLRSGFNQCIEAVISVGKRIFNKTRASDESETDRRKESDRQREEGSVLVLQEVIGHEKVAGHYHP